MIFHESRDNGFVQLRRNLLSHVEDGRMPGAGFMVMCALLILAESGSR
jgi:hypothetical protein